VRYTPNSIARQLEGLQRHIDSLDKSMQKLAGRLVPYNDESEAALTFSA
jgi:hypothetical protein